MHRKKAKQIKINIASKYLNINKFMLNLRLIKFKTSATVKN